jgi:integrase
MMNDESITPDNDNVLTLFGASGVVVADDRHGAERAAIDARVRRYFDKHFVKLNPNTRKAYTSDLSQYLLFCQTQVPVLDPLTPNDDIQITLVEHYIDYLVASTKKRATIDRHLVSVGKLLRIAGIRNPLREVEATRDYLKLALNQLDAHGELVKPAVQRQALPIDERLLDHINETFVITTLQHKRDIALLNFCFNTLLRGSEIGQIRVADLDPKNQQVFVRKTKTDKSGKGSYRHVSSQTFALIDVWLGAGNITEGPVFRALSPKGKAVKPVTAGEPVKGISYRSVYRIYQHVLSCCDVDPSGYSAHSCRVGAVVSMRRVQVDMAGIMQAGGWQSTAMVMRYGAETEAQHSGAAKLSALRKANRASDDESDK